MYFRQSYEKGFGQRNQIVRNIVFAKKLIFEAALSVYFEQNIYF